MECIAPDCLARKLKLRRNIVVPEVDAYWREVVIGATIKAIIPDPAINFSRDAIPPSFRILSAIDEKSLFNGAVIAARFNDFFHE